MARAPAEAPQNETAARAQPRAGGSVSSGAQAGAGAFFGRRKAKKLRPGQADLFATLLPTLLLPVELPSDPRALFDPPVREVRLEIGFGGGEHLLAAALAEPDVGFIGCEPFVNGMAKLLAAVAREKLGNLRLWTDDASPLLDRFPRASLARIDLFYPDPWPKRRQRKRRFVSDRTLRAMARALAPGGSFRFASDIDDYAGWTLARLARQEALQDTLEDALLWEPRGAGDWLEPHEGWVRTRYEAKAIAAGRTPTYLVARKPAA